jgi:hypothetical protein
METMSETESGISPTIHCECGLPTTYHKLGDGKTIFRCDFCDLLVATSQTEQTGT